MKVAKRDLFLVLLYLMTAIGVFPIVYYFFEYYVIGFSDTYEIIGTAEAALSGPMLVIAGIALTAISFTSLFKNRAHRVFGIVFFCGGVAWLVMVVHALRTME